MSNSIARILSPKIGFFLMFAMAAGAVVGPWLVQMSWWVSFTGPSLLLAVIATGLLLIPIAFCYGELGAMLPFAGGEYNYAQHAYGERLSWWIGWLAILLYVCAVSFMSMAVVWILKSVFSVNFTYIISLIISLFISFIFTLINVYSIKISAQIEMLMTVCLMIIGLIVAIIFLSSSHWTLENWRPFFSQGVSGWFVAVGMLVIMYTGFDAIVQMVEEANYPRKRHAWVLVGSIILIMCFYIVIVSGNSGMKPTSWITEQDLVSFNIIKEYWGIGFAYPLGIAAIFATLTTLNALLIAGIRTAFAVARSGWLPKKLGHVSDRDVPDFATWFVFVLSAVILIASGEKWLEAIMTVAAIAASLIYISVPLAVLLLKKRRPEWNRPFTVPIWVATLAIICALIILLGTVYGTPGIGWLVFIIFMAIGFIIYVSMLIIRKNDHSYLSLRPLDPTDIPDGRL